MTKLADNSDERVAPVGGAPDEADRHMAAATEPCARPPTIGACRRLVPRGITRNVVVLGLVSLFTDLSSEMLYPVIPLFVVGALGSSPALLGLIEGIAEGISSGLRWLGGSLSDRTGRRKPFVIAGYGLSALSKPLMGSAAFLLGWPLFLIGRSSDRLGKSIRTAARDALIADSTMPAYRGVAFGFHRAVDTCGAVLGPLVALLVITAWPGGALTWLFFLAFLPGLVSVILAGAGVHEVQRSSASPRPPGTPAARRRLPRAFWHLLVALAVFSVGNSSDSFLILCATELGLSFPQVILAYGLFNFVYAGTATPLGRLSDRIGRKPVLVAGWVTYAAVYLGFARLNSPFAPWGLMGVYGLYQALTEGVTKAMVSDIVPAQQRASAMGLVGTVSGLGQLAASVIVGALWHVRVFDGTLMVALTIGAATALLAVPVLAVLPTRGRAALGEASASVPDPGLRR